ncbi:Rne/Rng family ribonuclease [Actinophytocola sediminis]
MSDTTTPAGDAGGDTTTSISAALADLPARIRVHALAKLLGRSSRDVLAAVTDLGGDGRSPQSSIDRDTALRVAETFGLIEQPVAEDTSTAEPEPAEAPAEPVRRVPPTPVFASASPLFLPPEPPAARPAAAAAAPPAPPVRKPEPVDEVDEDETVEDSQDDDENDDSRPRRRRGRRGRGRGKGGQDDGEDTADDEPVAQEKPDKPEKSDKPESKRRSKPKAEEPEADSAEDDQPDGDESDAASRRRRRRRRRKGGTDDEGGPTEDDPPNTVVHVREARDDKDKGGGGDSDGRDEVRSVRGSTRLEAKRQRRRDGREAGRRRAPILSEAEFLARREAVDRAMVVRERGDRIQIGVLEDGVLVEHFVTSSGSGSLVGNVYLGRVQNVLPSMEAAFVDIGRGRNAVLYAGEVDWDAAGLEGKARKIEQALSTGDSVLVQVTKDPVGHKGARLTTQISLPGRFLVYVPGGGATGISRKLPENERRRLKDVLKRVVPEDAGVIIRTASEGISEEELARDVRRLQAQWQVIQDKTKGANGARRANSPALVYEEPDLLVKVVRDLFTEDFSALVIEGAGAWETVDSYVRHVAPELADRVRKHVGPNDVFAEYRIDEQLLKALDRKVWLPSGGYLVIDRTEAMTVIDVNTGKFTGSGGNLEETVTRNNLESAEEIVRQLRLRDIGGIIVIDFIDMVLESNRDLVLRRLTECLGRDRTRHQVAEVTSLGLVQMTRKRVGTGLLEAFGTTCEHCKGRGVLISIDPVGKSGGGGGNGHGGGSAGGGRRNRGNRGDDGHKDGQKDGQKDTAAKETKDSAAKEAAKAVRDIAAATTKTNGVDGEPEPEVAVASAEPSVAVDSGSRSGGSRSSRSGSRSAGPSGAADSSRGAGSSGAESGSARGDARSSGAGSVGAESGSARGDGRFSGVGSSGAESESPRGDARFSGAGSSAGAESRAAGSSGAESGSAGRRGEFAGAGSSGGRAGSADGDAAFATAGQSDGARTGDTPGIDVAFAPSANSVGSSADSADGTPGDDDAPLSADQQPSRTRRRSRRSTAPPSVTAEQAGVAPGVTQTVPAGEPGASTVIDSSTVVGDAPERTHGDLDTSSALSAPGARNGSHEQANGHAQEAEADHTSSPSEAADVPTVTPPARRPVRRGASRPAGPPVNATHDG